MIGQKFLLTEREMCNKCGRGAEIRDEYSIHAISDSHTFCLYHLTYQFIFV